MKKLFTLLLMGSVSAANLLQAQALPNFGFDSWKGKGNCGITYLTATTATSNQQNRPGDEPAGWSGSNINQVMNITALCTQGTDEGNYTKLKNYNAFVQIVPAYLTLGSPWVFAYGSSLDMMNYAKFGDGGSCGGIEFAYKPDALKFKYKHPSTTEETAHAIAYLWKGTFTSNVPSACDKNGTITNYTQLDDVDRVVLGKQTDGINTKGELIASLDYEITETTTTWQEVTIPLNYQSNSVPEKLNVIFSAGDYWTRANLKGNSELHIDDVQFVYNSELTRLTYDGTTINTTEGVYAYEVPAVYGSSKQLECVSNGKGATIETAYNEQTGVLTVTVKGNDISVNAGNLHTYTFQFAKAMTTYTNSLLVDVDGSTIAPTEESIILIQEMDDSYSFLLPNFSFEIVPGSSILLGDIKMTNLTRTEENGTVTYTGTQDMTLEALGLPLTVKLSAIEKDGNLVATLPISVINGTMSVNVTFAPSLTIDGTTGIDLQTDGLYNVTFNRSFPAGWSTICLPYATTVEALGAAQVQAFTEYTGNTLTFEKVASGKMDAHTPYLIYFEQATTVSDTPWFSVNGVTASSPKTVTHGNVTFTGNYEAGRNMEGLYGVAEKDGAQYIMRGGAGSTLGSTGAYFTVSGSEVNSLHLRLDGIETSISGVQTGQDGQAFDIYSLNGIKVRSQAATTDGLPKGIYLINGKKHIVK